MVSSVEGEEVGSRLRYGERSRRGGRDDMARESYRSPIPLSLRSRAKGRSKVRSRVTTRVRHSGGTQECNDGGPIESKAMYGP